MYTFHGINDLINIGKKVFLEALYRNHVKQNSAEYNLLKLISMSYTYICFQFQ